MAKAKRNVDEYKDIFVKLHRYQIHGAYNLILLLSRYLLALPIVPFAIYVASWLAEWFIPPYHNAQLLWNDKSLPFHKRFSRWFTAMWLDAYRDNCFEREAYANESNPNYLFERRWCGWAWYAIKKVDRNGK